MPRIGPRLVPALLFTVLVVPAPAQVAPTEAGIEKLRDDYVAAFGKGDAAALAALYDADAISVSPMGQVRAGRAAIQRAFADDFAGRWKGATMSLMLGRQRQLGTDMWLVEGTFSVTGLKNATGGPAAPMNGRFMNVVVRQGGSWLIAGSSAFVPLGAVGS